jgi:hypothetical protein
MITALLTIFLLFVPGQAIEQISDAQKKSFIELSGPFRLKVSSSLMRL